MAIIETEFLELTQHLDVQAFWAENALCWGATPDKPRCPLRFAPDDHWLFEFLDVGSTLRYYQDKTYRDDLHRTANQVTQQYVGKTFFDEDTWQHQPKRIENLFGSHFSYKEGSTPWLTPVTDDPDEFARILDQAEATTIADWVISDAFMEEWKTRKARGDTLPTLGDGSRGPATIMTSVLPVETVFFWMYDRPALMMRFRDILGEKMVELNQVLREFSGNTQPGWWITDDNCVLFNQKLYDEFCAPVLERVLNTFASGDVRRYQHSDSSMAHHLDTQRELGINVVNYGPEVDVAVIREKMPDAIIEGQMPPFLLRSGAPDAIRAQVIADFEKAGATGCLVVATAGSLSAGTGVGRMRWLMQIVNEVCRYDNPRSFYR